MCRMMRFTRGSRSQFSFRCVPLLRQDNLYGMHPLVLCSVLIFFFFMKNCYDLQEISYNIIEGDIRVSPLCNLPIFRQKV